MTEESVGVPSERKVHRSKGVVERNLPRWFRKPAFRPWDDFLAFFRNPGNGADAQLAQDFQELEQKGDEASPKGLGKLIKYYNRNRRFAKGEIAPPWFFVEAAPRTGLPADEAWTIEVAVNLDHERSQNPPPKFPPKSQPQGSRTSAPAQDPQVTDAPPRDGSVAAEAEDAPRPHGGVVHPPMSDRQWFEALRRLPTTIQVLVDGRGKNASELNDRRRKALELSQHDRAAGLAKLGAEMRKELLLWLLEKKRDAKDLDAEIKKRLEGIEDWIKQRVAEAQAKLKELDEHARADLEKRLRGVYPKMPDEAFLAKLARSALDASRPKRRESWARKVLDDFNNSRGSAAEKVRDPRLVEGLIRWLSARKDDDTPTDGEIYDHIQRLGGPNMAAKKRRPEGPRPPRPPEREIPKDDEDEPAQPAKKA